MDEKQLEQDCYEDYARKAREYEQTLDLERLLSMVTGAPIEESDIAFQAVLNEAPRTVTMGIIIHKMKCLTSRPFIGEEHLCRV